MTVAARREHLRNHLVRAILVQDLLPGRELDEADLCARFDLSRTPVRDVFRDLEGQGYVRVRGLRGARVAELNHKTLRDFFLTAPMVYAAVLRLAARNATPAQIDALKSAQTAFRAALRGGQVADRSLANHQFHQITGEMAANVYLEPSFSRLLIDHARIGMTFYSPKTAKMTENLAAAAEQHDAIIAAIEAQDEAAAARLSDDHWALSRGQIEAFVMPKSLEFDLAAGQPAGGLT